MQVLRFRCDVSTMLISAFTKGYIPVCIGIGSAKTLAKLANHIAKKNPQFEGVFDMTTYPESALATLLSKISVAEVWGVVQRIAAKLDGMGIRTVADLRGASPNAIRLHFSVVLERTVAELHGISCLTLEEVAPPKKQIVSSKSFGQMVTSLEELGRLFPPMSPEPLKSCGCRIGLMPPYCSKG